MLGFDSVLLLSKTGKYIFLLIRSDDKDLKKLAQQQEYKLWLEIGSSDATSLEPCDSLLWPLSKIKPPDDIADQVKILEDKVSQAINRINMVAQT